MTYTTQQLIEILDQELKATWRGQRLVLSLEERVDYPVVAQALDPTKLSRVYAYQDFRAQVHEYQQKHQVSGIIWRECKFKHHQILVPEVYNQLIALPEDKTILMQSKQSILDFWWQVTQEMHYWLADVLRSQSGAENQRIPRDFLTKMTQQAEWAELDTGKSEVYLGLCWGNPQEHQYQWAKPESGCDRIIAALEQPSPINIF